MTLALDWIKSFFMLTKTSKEILPRGWYELIIIKTKKLNWSRQKSIQD